ncbi:ABC transporter ATP-binding protein [Verrucomicrobiota bacterium]
MSETAISIRGLGKRYRLGETVDFSRTFREVLMAMGRHYSRKAKRAAHTLISGGTDDSPTNTASGYIWALRDINLDIKEGEVLGIIGRNGAGKSTLLKILSRITAPTEGEADIRGRIGSLLEVGTGFHPELTGRENIFLNGAILGMRKAEIEKKFDEIVSFAEIEKFIDTPVKRYSSGMYVRLAFSVAAHLEPDILLVDEVLAVGDTAFQKKCLGRMNDVAKEGRTVLFVSHNMATVLNLCSRGILLDNGNIVKTGKIKSVVDHYLNADITLSGEATAPQRRHKLSDDFRFSCVRVRKPMGEITAQVDLIEGCNLEIEYEILHPFRSANIGFILWNSSGHCVFTSTDVDNNPSSITTKREPGRYIAQCHIPPEYLRPGRYYIDVASSIPNVRILDELPRVLMFEVIDTGSVESKISQGRQGVIAPVLDWKTEQTK